MSTQCTPGPWELRPDEMGGLSPLIFVANEEFPVASVTGYFVGQRLANARLIAAAPELLSVARQWAALDAGAWHVARHASEKAQLMAETLAAIARATGEQA